MTVALPFDVTTLPADGELLLNVEYRLKDSEPLLEPDHRIAYEQFVLRESAPADLSVQERMADRCNSLGTLTVRDNDRNYLIVESPAMRIDFRKSDGLMTRYEVNGKALLNEGAALEPDFWRAPTDNDFGAKLNEENRVWEHPGLRLLKLEHGVEKGIAVVTARYDMEKIDAVLTLEYRLNNAGEITVREQLTAGERTDVPRHDAFRHAYAYACRIRPYRLLWTRTVGKLCRSQGRSLAGTLPPNRRRTVLSLHPSAGDRNEIRRAMLAAIGHYGAGYRGRRLGAVLRFGAQLFAGGTG